MIIPPIKIQGKKTKIVPKIMEIADGLLSEHPEIDTWVEPFLGSGVVAFKLSDTSKWEIIGNNCSIPDYVYYITSVFQDI